MKTKPKVLIYISLILMGIAIGFPLQIMVLYGHTPFEWTAIAAKLPPLNWLVMSIAPVAAWCVYRASPWAFMVIPSLVAAVIYNNWFVAELATDYSPLTVGIGTGLFLLLMGSMADHKVLQLFFAPERRWWLTPFRRRVKLPVKMKIIDTEVEGITIDISATGAFITLPAHKTLSPGMRCSVAVKLRWLRAIRCRAEVVRTSTPTGDHPAGVGIRFLGLGWRERNLLNHFAMSAAKQ